MNLEYHVYTSFAMATLISLDNLFSVLGWKVWIGRGSRLAPDTRGHPSISQTSIPCMRTVSCKFRRILQLL